MEHKYQALLEPLQIRGVILKNRMMSGPSTPHFLQGTEDWPTEKIISHFAGRAKSGAAAITINHLHKDAFPFHGRAIDNPPGHFNLYDLGDYSAQNYLCQLVDAIHFYGAKATGYLMADAGWFYPDGIVPEGAGPGGPPMMDMPHEPMSSEVERMGGGDHGPGMHDINGLTHEMLENYVKNVTREAMELKRLGFDIISMHCCYRHSPHASFLSPITNHRTDKYGGSLENRSRLILEIYRSMRAALGNTPLEIVYSVSEPEGGYTVEDTIEFAKMAEGIIDILHLRSGDLDPQHPLGYTSTEANPTPFLEDMAKVTKAVRESGLNMVVGASAGFQNIDHANKALEDGKADLIYMARSWINNPDYGKLVCEGRGGDVVPCIRCNKCHVPNGRDMWRSVCSVNPRIGLEDKLERMIELPGESQNVAVVGGGPAGLEFAKTAAERGHKVTLYEASNRLGGQLNHADYPSFKWPLRQFKDYLAERMDVLGVDVKLNTLATPDMLRDKYDAVAVAVGASPFAPRLPGIDGGNVHYAANVYGKLENELSDSIVMIGGGEIGVETALYLCELGKKVHVLELLPELIADAPHAHYKSMVQAYWRRQPNFSYQCGVRVTAIDADGVRYLGHKGNDGYVKCGDVLLAIGLRSNTELAMSFAGVAPRVLYLGDCDAVGNVQKAVRAGFALASAL